MRANNFLVVLRPYLFTYSRRLTDSLTYCVNSLVVLDGELAVPFTCNPLQQGLIPRPRSSFVRAGYGKRC